MPVRNGMRIAQLIPGARYVELPGVGHLVPYEAPAAVAADRRATDSEPLGVAPGASSDSGEFARGGRRH